MNEVVLSDEIDRADMQSWKRVHQWPLSAESWSEVYDYLVWTSVWSLHHMESAATFLLRVSARHVNHPIVTSAGMQKRERTSGSLNMFDVLGQVFNPVNWFRREKV